MNEQQVQRAALILWVMLILGAFLIVASAVPKGM